MDDKMLDIQSRMDKLFSDKFGRKFDSKSYNIKDENLLGASINFKPLDLVCLFFEVEKEFNIKISQDYIISGRFNTYNNICRIIYEIMTNDNENVNLLSSVYE